MAEPIIIPQQYAEIGDVIEFQGETYKADKHFSSGKDMIDLYSHIMFTNTGAFGMVNVTV